MLYLTLFALSTCQGFVDALADNEPYIDTYYYACKAAMKQEVGEIESFNCTFDGRFGWCEFEVTYEQR